MIKILRYTEKPLSLMGEVASRCWNSKPSPQIGIDCIESGHGRISEYADVIVEISDYSARVMREIYTHISGTSRVQSSTRYIDYSEFEYYMPDSILNNPERLIVYENIMNNIKEGLIQLIDLNTPKEDSANALPIGYISTMVLKINIRAIIYMAEIRMCTRAYKEYREFMDEFLDVLRSLDQEWNYVIDNHCKPKCVIRGYCGEKHSCGKMPTKQEVLEGYWKYKELSK